MDGVEVADVLRLMETVMVPPDKNCSERVDTPSAREFLANLEPFQIVLLVIAAAFTTVVYLLAFVHWYYVYSFVSIETRRNKLYWLVTLFPYYCNFDYEKRIIPQKHPLLLNLILFPT
ncbi:unnamed protein product [Cylicostephanus goldi]|uniref:Uncharacterized protein n=1 Tax=Cylicostephanus goldi TaxID=71465 RepID=A0A3P6R9T8_CYLGO|nr:unnamed protein product [Cylicostephanus goldi]